MARSFPFDGASFGRAFAPTTFGLWNFASVRIRRRKRTVRRVAVRSSKAADAQAGQLASCSGTIRARAYGRATLPLRRRGHPNRDTLAVKSLQKMYFRRNNSEHRPRPIIPAALTPPRYFLKIGRAARRRFRLIRIRRMNRLSGDLFGVPSHICTTSIESKIKRRGI